MSELDEEWGRVLAEAERRARTAGRGDLVEYLRLRASNDRARSTGVEWLFATFTQLAGEANRTGAGVQLTKKEGLSDELVPTAEIRLHAILGSRETGKENHRRVGMESEISN